jgi:hypothetical protein
MGADASTKPIVCTRTAKISSVDMEEQVKNIDLNISQEDSTLTHSAAEKIVETCSQLTTHDAELKALKEIGKYTPILPSEIGTDPNYKYTIVWFNTLGFVVLHLIAFWGVWMAFSGECDIRTSLYCEWSFDDLYRRNFRYLTFCSWFSISNFKLVVL